MGSGDETTLSGLEAALETLAHADQVARCPTCGCCNPTAQAGQEMARIQGQMARLRAKIAYANGETAQGVTLDRLAKDYLETERKAQSNWAVDEVMRLRQASDKRDQQVDQFNVLRGRPKKKVTNIALVPEQD